MICVGFLCVIIGLFVMFAAYLNLESFFKPRRHQFAVFEWFGRGCARYVYGGFGLLLVVIGLAIMITGIV